MTLFLNYGTTEKDMVRIKCTVESLEAIKKTQDATMGDVFVGITFGPDEPTADEKFLVSTYITIFEGSRDESNIKMIRHEAVRAALVSLRAKKAQPKPPSNQPKPERPDEAVKLFNDLKMRGTLTDRECSLLAWIEYLERMMLEVIKAGSECADDLEAELNGRYGPLTEIHPAMMRRYTRDIDTVKRWRKVLDSLKD